jgi:hypothetical protein
MSSVVTTDFPPDADFNLGILKIRVDKATQSVFLSTTGATIDVLYSVQLCVPDFQTVSATSGSSSGMSTKLVELTGSTIDALNKFVEIRVLDTTHMETYLITVARTSSDPLFAISILKV